MALLADIFGAQWPELLHTVPMDIRRNMWLTGDRAVAHFSYAARNYLETAYTGRWKGSQGPVFTRPDSHWFSPLGTSNKFCVRFSGGYCSGTAAARSTWLYLGLQHSWHVSALPSIYALLRRSLCGSAWPTFWAPTVTLTTVVTFCPWNVKWHVFSPVAFCSWAELFCYWQRLFDLSSTQVVLAYDIKVTFENWSSTILTLQETSWRPCVSLLNGNDCDGKRQVVIHIVHSKLQFPSKVSPAYVIYVANVLILLLLRHFRMALVPYRTSSGPGLLNNFHCFGP
jgi:hypothetical protein